MMIMIVVLMVVLAAQEAPVRFPSKIFVVDLMHDPGRLMKIDTPEAATYCQQ